MSILKLLKDALEWDDPYEDMPDYSSILQHLGLDPDTDEETVREHIELEVEALEPEGDSEGESNE